MITRPSATVAVGRRALRQVWLGATIWALAFGATIAASALSYVGSFPTAASRAQLAATTSGDTGLAVLLGPVSAVDTVGGYTVYKCFVFITTIGAIWAVLASTRLLRGEEDAGRWGLVLSGDLRARRATAATLGAIGAAVGIIFVGTTLITLLAARKPGVGFGVGETVLYGASLMIAPATFAAVGAVTSQLGRTRRLASGLGLTLFGLALVVRMIADSGPATRWLLWTTPFGWTELVRPFTDNDPWPLLLAAVAVAVLALLAVVLVARRDVGAGVLASSDVSAPRTFGLRSPFGLAARLELPVLVAWGAGAAAAGYGFGIVAEMTTRTIPDSLQNTLDRFDVKGAFVDQYLGVAFLLVAVLVALVSASTLGALADEETSGRLVQVLTRPPSRVAVFAGRLVLGAVAVVVAGLIAGVTTWLGAATQGIDLRLGRLVAAGLNVVPTALVVLGIGALVLSLAPRVAARAVYAIVIASVLVDLLGSMVTGLGWLEHVSLFHYMALAPAQDPQVVALVVNLVVAVALCAVALVFFDRRDLQSA